MPAFTLEDLIAIARETIGSRAIQLTPTMTAADVPGWDSLNHTLIALEISSSLGVKVEPRELAEASNFGDVVERVNRIAAAG